MLSPHPTGVQFQNINVEGYENINGYFQQDDRLYGTETMCGDWNGTLLLLAQDFCHTKLIEARLASNRHINPFYHDQKFRTNQNLVTLLASHYKVQLNGANARNCKVLYGSAIWLLKISNTASGRLPKPVTAIRACRPVLKATVNTMSNLRKIFCLGQIAYQVATKLYGIPAIWREDLNAHHYRESGKILICPLPHPGFWGINRRGGLPTIQDDFLFYLGL